MRTWVISPGLGLLERIRAKEDHLVHRDLANGALLLFGKPVVDERRSLVGHEVDELQLGAPPGGRLHKRLLAPLSAI
jgi:hypothetical protein